MSPLPGNFRLRTEKSGGQPRSFPPLSRISLLLGVLLLAGAVFTWQHLAGARPSVRVGVLHSLTGPLAINEKPLMEAIQLAVEEANVVDGIHGHRIETIVVDCRSDAAYCAEQAEHLIVREQVQALFGCWSSACRKAVKEVVEKHDHLLFYALRYEGMEQSPNIIYGGAVPNQLVMPAVHWGLVNLGNRKRTLPGTYPENTAKRVYLAGSDYVFSHVLTILIKDLLATHDAVVVGERHIPVGSADMDDLAADIVRQRPDLVLNTIAGTDNAAFFQALAKIGITADRLPVLSFSLTEVGLTTPDAIPMAGHYAARNYFQSIATPGNEVFVTRFRERYGQNAVIDSPSEASYINMRMWIQAALEAGAGDLDKVQRTILRQSLPAPEGVVALDPITQHAWKIARIGRAREDGQFDVVWDSGQPLEPEPFPTYRSREEWSQLLDPPMNGPSAPQRAIEGVPVAQPAVPPE